MPLILGAPSSSLGIGAGSGATGGGTASGGGASSQIAAIGGDVFIGGGLGYTQRIKRDGTFLQLIHEYDPANNNAEVWGQAISGVTGDRYSALNAVTNGLARYDASAPGTQVWFKTTTDKVHDVVWLPNNSGLYVLRSPSSGSLKLYKYDLDGNVTGGPWTLAIDTGWTTAPAKLDVACDSDTVSYTMQGLTIKQFKVSTTTQLADYETLTGTDATRYIFGDLRVLNDGRVIVAMTDTGDGPRRGVALSNDTVGLAVWIDEINPATTYHVYKRKALDGTPVLAVLTNLAPPNPPDGVNAPVFSLAAFYARCVENQIYGFVATQY